MSIELKPCPFCGGEPIMSSYTYSLSGAGIQYKVECERHNCPAQPTVDWHYWTAEEAAEAWNTRAERTCRMDYVGYIGTEESRASIYQCSKCNMRYMSANVPDPGEYCMACGAKVVD